MSKLKVERLAFSDLSPSEKAGVPNNGHGREYANYIRVSHGDKVLYLESDACEPEDATFGRDFSWVIDAINKAYELGLADNGEG